jgi:hypothetical protein
MSDLTYIQRVALRGEVGKIVALYSKHDEDVPFGCFMAMSMYTADYFKDVVKILEELVDEDIVQRVTFYYQSRVVPYDIYASKMVADMLYYITDDVSVANVMYLRSLFCNFIMKLEKMSPTACHLVLNKVMQEEDLEPLHEDAFYLRSNIPLPIEVKEDDLTAQEKLDKYIKDCSIFGVSILSADLLSFVDTVTGVEEDAGEEPVEKTTSIYEDLREKFIGVPDTSYFIVDKIDVTTGNCVSTRNFVSIEDVITYLKDINLEELTSDTYQYIISEGVVDDGK